MASKRIDWKTLEPALRKLKKDESLHVLRNAYEAQRLPQPRRPPPRCLPLPAATAGSCRRSTTTSGAASACAAMPRARGYRLRLLLAYSQAAPTTGDHGGIMRQPERNCLLMKAAAIPYALGEGHRALRAPASPSVLYADSQAPKVKSGQRPPAVIMPAAMAPGVRMQIPSLSSAQGHQADRGQCG